jgi:hypothetical protein
VLVEVWLAPPTCLAGGELVVVVLGCLGGLLVLGRGFAPPPGVGVGVDERGGLVLVVWGVWLEAALDGGDGFCWGIVAGLVGVWVGVLVLVLAAAVVLGPLVSG